MGGQVGRDGVGRSREETTRTFRGSSEARGVLVGAATGNVDRGGVVCESHSNGRSRRMGHNRGRKAEGFSVRDESDSAHERVIW